LITATNKIENLPNISDASINFKAPTPMDAASGQRTGQPDLGEPNSSVERQTGVTTFIDSEDTVVEQSLVAKMKASCLLGSDDKEAISIANVLARPTFVTNVTWDSTQTAGTLLAVLNLPNDVIGTSLVKTVKVQYNQFLHADVVVRIEASSVQFQAGRLWMAFEPYRAERGARSNTTRLSAMTALPGVEFDPSKPGPVELRVPFQSIVAAWDLPLGQLGFGNVLIAVLSPLNSSSTTNSVTLSVQTWMENACVTVPTQYRYASVAPSKDAVHPLQYPYGEPLEFQSSEEGLAQTHRFSSITSKVASVAKFLGRFPLVSAVAAPVASFAEGVTEFLSSFGYSKPADTSCPTKFMQHNRAAWANSSGPLPVVKLTDSIENAVDQRDNYFGNVVDEMDISYIASQMCVANSYAWSTTDAVGKIITVVPVHPGLCQVLENSPADHAGVFQPTMLAFVSSMFKYWSGAIKLKMEAISTPFHAGRLMVVYVPDYDPLTFTSSINDVGNNYSMVWDITTAGDINFEVPYVSNSPFLNVILDDASFQIVTAGATAGAQPRHRQRKIANGAIVVYVLNQLVAPSNAAPSIAIQTWIGGGEDFTLAEPVFGVYRAESESAIRVDFTGLAYNATALTQPASGQPPARLEASPQDGSYDEVDCKMAFQSDMRGFIDRGPDTRAGSITQMATAQQFIPMKRVDRVALSKLSQGEIITNLRTLTRRMMPSYSMYPHDVTIAGAWDNTVIPPNSNHVLTFDPDYYGSHTGNGLDSIIHSHIAPTSIGNKPWLFEHETALTYISRIYAFVRGSRRYGISASPSNVINGARFNSLNDEIYNAGERGTWQFSLSPVDMEDSVPFQPFFRPDSGPLGINYDSNTDSTFPINNYGFNTELIGTHTAIKSGESGCALTVEVPHTGRYPIKLVSTSNAPFLSFMSTIKNNAPRSRRCLELRYRPFSTSRTEETANYVPFVWPFPMHIFEAAGDDHSFGGLTTPPIITKTGYTMVSSSTADGSLIGL